MIIDYVNVAKVLGLDVSRIVVETADKDLSKRITSIGAKVVRNS
jgi:post-segregation antitoxin (ccd killing protein)